MACTFRVAGPAARLGLPEIRMGLIPGFGGTQLLPRLIGEARAIEIDRKSTRLTPVTNAHLVCRLLLETKNNIDKNHTNTDLTLKSYTNIRSVQQTTHDTI